MDSGVGLSTILGIVDPTFNLTVAKYGDPSVNMEDMQDFPEFTPIQKWEMWLHKPEPSVSYDPQLLSSVIEGFNKIENRLQNLMDKFFPPLSNLLGGYNEQIEY